MNKKILTGLIQLSLLGGSALGLSAQERQVAKADKEFQSYAFIDAREAYLKIVEKGFVSQEVVEKISDSYYFNSEYDKGAIWYGKLYGNYKPDMDPTHLFRYAQCLKAVEMYEDADRVMEEYQQATGDTQNLTEKFSQERDYLDKIALQSGRFKINNLDNINTEGADFGPSFGRDGALLFASARSASKISKTVHEWNEASFLDLYETHRVSANSLYVDGLEKIDRLNTHLHESSTVMTKDGSTLYFTRNNLLKNKKGANEDGTTLLKLYKATRGKSGKWEDVQELPFNSDAYSVAHPALSPDEKRLYFASDMPGTMGMSDLFYVDISEDGSYSDPINLGDRINTEARETFPFISNSGTLFFASNGHPGLGGLDVFLSLPNEIKLSKSLYNEPYNIGEPVNSPDDDFSFIIDEETKIGFFSSNRAGGVGGDDIYSVKQLKDLVTSCDQYLTGIVSDEVTNEPLEDAVVTLFDENMNKLEVTTSDSEGKYELPIHCTETYVVRAQKTKYSPVEENFVSNEEFNFTHNLPFRLANGEVLEEKQEFRVGDDLAKILQLEPIYFDLNKSYIRPDAEVELQKVLAVLEEHPTMEIDVRSHTDSRASHSYNRSLSDRRAKSTMRYLIEKGGIESRRITGRGYGETQLVNACSDGVPCSEADHQLNRRSEFIILKL